MGTVEVLFDVGKMVGLNHIIENAQVLWEFQDESVEEYIRGRDHKGYDLFVEHTGVYDELLDQLITQGHLRLVLVV